MAKTVYMWDSNNKYCGAKVGLPDDYTLAANETFTKPEGENGVGLQTPIIWTGSNWRGGTDEEHAEYEKKRLSTMPNISVKIEPSKSDQALNNIGLQLAQTQTQIQTTNEAINALG
uniref:hypothetical protein n=1 Tax=Limosilactobacillus caecicola TaxID=2941332 RepID=UPI00203E15B5